MSNGFPTGRLPGESARAYAAYLAYEEMGPGRSRAAVTAGTDKAPRGQRLAAGHIGRWSVRWRWVERAAAHDRLVEEQVRAAQLADAIEYRKRAAQQARAAVQSLMLPAMGLSRRIARLGGAEQALEALPTVQLLKLAIEAARVLPDLLRAEALALGEPTERIEGRPAEDDALTIALAADPETRYAIAVAMEKATRNVVKVEERS
jgi:hypothetical protein